MKLVNIHQHVLVLMLLLFGAQAAQAQVWSLDKCVQTASTNNKKLEIDRNAVEMRREKQEQVKAYRMPKVKLEADYKYFIDLPTQLMPMSVFGGPEGQYKDAQFGVPHNINANIQVAYPLYNPQIKSNIDNAAIGIEMAEIQYQKSEEEIYFEISNLYYNAQILLNQKQFIEDNLVNTNKLHNTLKLLKEQKLATGTDLDKVVLQKIQLEEKRDILSSKYDQILNGMKVLMGVSFDEKIEIEPKVEYQQTVDYPSQTITDMRLLETKSRFLKGELNTLKKSQLPTVMLYGSYGVTGYGYDQSPNEFLDFYPLGFVGVKATYNLFDGNVTKKKRKIKQRELVNNRLQLELLTDKNELEMRNAKLKIGIARRTIETGQSQIDYAQSIYDQTLFQQKNDMASITDVLLADSSVREAQNNYIAAIVEYLKADLELKKISGNILK